MNDDKIISGCCAKGEHDLCGGDSKFGFCQCHCHDAPVRYWKRKAKESEKELERVQKQAAAMRKALIYTENWLLGAHDEKGEIAPDYPIPHVQAALQPDAGSSFVPRAELERVRRNAAAMRARIEKRIANCLNPHGSLDGPSKYCAECEADMAALQLDSGSSYLSWEQVKPLVDALRKILRGDYDNAHSPRGAALVAESALEHARTLSLL